MKNRVEWQKLKEIGKERLEEVAPFERMQRLAKDILSADQYKVFMGVSAQFKSFSELAKELKVTSSRISQLWHSANSKVQAEWTAKCLRK